MIALLAVYRKVIILDPLAAGRRPVVAERARLQDLG
jgi:hypothetical protein